MNDPATERGFSFGEGTAVKLQSLVGVTLPRLSFHLISVSDMNDTFSAFAPGSFSPRRRKIREVFDCF
jgi:hypothetical protein